MSVLVLILTLGVGNVWGADVTDVITASNLAATGTTYTNFSGVSITSDAVYAGQSAKDSSGNIQLRSKNSNSGIVTTASGGNRVKSVKITVGSGSNTVDVYGKTSAYSGASDLYSSSTQGTKLGSVSATGTITVTGDYTYVGIRSNSGAIYLSSIEITWETGSGGCSTPPTVGASSNSSISVTGATVSCTGITKGDCDIDEWGFFYKTGSGGVTTSDTKVQVSAAKSTTNVSSFNKSFTELNPNTHYYFAAYAKVGSNYYLSSETDFTTKTLTSSSSNTTYGTVSRSGRVITGTLKAGGAYGSPAYSVTGASGGSTTTVEREGNRFTVTSNSTSNITVTINFEAKGCTDHGASSITGGALSDADHGPLHAYYDYSTSQILYTKSDLDLAAGKKGTIKSIYFEYSGATAMAARTIKIYMANTDLSSLTTSNYVPYASFTQVYSGTFSCGSAGWYEITLDTPFDYNGAGQLAVMIDDNTNTYESSKSFKYHSATGKQIYKRQDDTDIDPASWTPASAIDYRPNTKFCIQEADMVQYTVNWYVNGSLAHSQTAYAGTTLTGIPTPDESDCDGSKVFVGWYTSPYSHATDAPDFVSPTTIPNGGANYYAVFATESIDASGEETITINTSVLTSYATVDKKIGGITFKSTGNWGAQSWSSYTYLQGANGKVLYNHDAFPGYIKSITITPQSSAGVSGKAQLAVGTTVQPSSYSADITTTSTTNYTAINNYTYLAIKANGATALASISITYASVSTTYSNYETTCCTSLGSINGSVF